MSIHRVRTRSSKTRKNEAGDFPFNREMIPALSAGWNGPASIRDYRERAWESYVNLPMPTVKDDFIQQEPKDGQPPTEKTEAWLFYDDQALYISAICWQDPALRMVANDMRRDGQNIFRNDNFGVMLDTFNDKRNGFLFQTNPIGGLSESQMNDEGNNFNRDWNTVWDVRTARFDRGWTVEMAIPLKSLRFPAGQQQVWGINFRRIVQSKSEYSYLAPIPASGGFRGLARVSLAATMVGLEVGTGTAVRGEAVRLGAAIFAIARLGHPRPISGVPDKRQ